LWLYDIPVLLYDIIEEDKKIRTGFLIHHLTLN